MKEATQPKMIMEFLRSREGAWFLGNKLSGLETASGFLPSRAERTARLMCEKDEELVAHGGKPLYRIERKIGLHIGPFELPSDMPYKPDNVYFRAIMPIRYETVFVAGTDQIAYRTPIYEN